MERTTNDERRTNAKHATTNCDRERCMDRQTSILEYSLLYSHTLNRTKISTPLNRLHKIF